MEQNNHLLDEFLQGKVEEAEFSYHESYWKKMSEILDDEEKKKRFPFFWRGLSILIGIIVVGAGAYILLKLSNKKKTVQATREYVTTPTNTQSMLPSINQDSPAQPNETQNQNRSNTNTSTNNAVKNTDNGIAPKNTAATQSNDLSNTKSKSVSTSNDSNNSEAKGPSSSSTNNIVGTNQSTSTTSNSNDGSGSNINPIPASKKSEKKVRSQKWISLKPDNKLVEKRNSEAGNAKGENILSKNTDELGNRKPVSNDLTKLSNEQAVNSASSNATVLGRNMKPIDTVQYVRRQAIDPAVSNPRYLSSLSNYIPERLDSVTIITFKPLEQNKSVALEPQSLNESEKVKVKYRFEWSLLAGLNLNKGFKSTLSNPNSWAVSPYLGIGIEKQMSPKITMASQVGFTYFNGLNSEIKVSANQYGFGLDSSTFLVAHKKLLQLYLPISLYYEVLNNHYLMASLGISYAFDVSSKVTEQGMSYNAGYQTANTKSATKNTSTQSGYRTGFNQLDVFAQIGYSYKLFSNIMLQCSFQQGFFDMTKNSYFTNTIRNTQSRVSIGLKYNFKRN